MTTFFAFFPFRYALGRSVTLPVENEKFNLNEWNRFSFELKSPFSSRFFDDVLSPSLLCSAVCHAWDNFFCCRSSNASVWRRRAWPKAQRQAAAAAWGKWNERTSRRIICQVKQKLGFSNKYSCITKQHLIFTENISLLLLELEIGDGEKIRRISKRRVWGGRA